MKKSEQMLARLEEKAKTVIEVLQLTPDQAGLVRGLMGLAETAGEMKGIETAREAMEVQK